MATVDTRPYSKNYSGLETQTIVAVVIGTLCLTSFELMRRKRRITRERKAILQSGSPEEGLGSVESWEWGYLYQGRCWAKRPSPPLPTLPLAWIKQMIMFKEADFLPLIGPDSTVYARFLRGTWYFTLLHTLTTLIILLPIHLVHAPDDIPTSSMTRASIGSLVNDESGKRLLPVHLVLLIWISATWIANLFWICRGAFRYRRQAIKQAGEKAEEDEERARDHPVPGVDEESRRQLRGWRLRTVMVTNIPAPLRDERLLKQYFDFYLALVRSAPPPAPGLIAGVVAFLHRFAQARAARDVERDTKRIDEEIGETSSQTRATAIGQQAADETKDEHAVIDKIVIVRKMTELASLLERRDEVLRKLEESHIKLARKTLGAVKEWEEQKRKGAKSTAKFLKRMSHKEMAARAASVKCKERTSGDEPSSVVDMTTNMDKAEHIEMPTDEEEQRVMNSLSAALKPYLEEFGMMPKEEKPALGFRTTGPWLYRRLRGGDGAHSRESSSGDAAAMSGTYPPTSTGTDQASAGEKPTIWEVLHTLPRHDLDAFQPLIRLNSLFRGATVPAIDYYTTKLGLLTALIHESRSKPTAAFLPASTAFVTFADPEDALRAIRLIPSHPKNPIACLVTAAPEYGDLDWSRLMTKTYTGEFLKDWVVDIGVWTFTCLWIIPVTFFVSLVSINSLSTVWPGLSEYLSKHSVKRELLSSLVPTLLVTGLSILVPLILLLIAKKAHNIVQLSKLHDQIMTRYHKFLVCNVLIFFCVGVSALQAFLASFKHPVSPLPVLAQKFPDAAPFYVGWLIFQTAMHAGLELGLLGLPLLVYPATVLKAITPRQRKAGTRPRTFNFYYWLPNHLIVLFVLFCFSLLNPLVIPFAFLYFSVAFVVFRHQFLHVYSKAYEMNATVLLIRMVRYSLDGIILSEFIFLALMIILKEDVLAGLTGVCFALTILMKLYMTWYIRANYAIDTITEVKAICGESIPSPEEEPKVEEAPVMEPLSPSDTINTVGEERLVGSRTEHDSMGSRLNGLLRNHRPHIPHGRHRSEQGTSGEHNSSVRFWTWKLPTGGVQFAYSTLPVRAARAPRHPANPFGPNEPVPPLHTHRDKEAGSQASVAQLATNPGVLQLADPQPAIYTDPFSTAPVPNTSMVDLYTTRRPDLVQPHGRRLPWDDAPRYDLTYENPHYTRQIENTLWLPMDPCGDLDLDQTVIVLKAITSEPGAGALGQWVNESSSIAAEAEETHRMMEPTEGDERVTELPVMGTERIELGRTIESRVEADNEGDVEQSENAPAYFGLARPQSTRRKSSSISMTSTQAGPGGRSFSGGTIASTQGGHPARTLRTATSRLSAHSQHNVSPTTPISPNLGLGLPANPPVTPRGANRMKSVKSAKSRIRSGSIVASMYSTSPFDPSDHVDLGSQSPFADPNFNIVLRSPSRFIDDSPEEEIPREFGGLGPLATEGPSGPQEFGASGDIPRRRSTQLALPVSAEGNSGSRQSRTITGRARSNSRFSVTTREAVVGEVLAEEQIAATERVKKETEESEQAGAPRSFLTSWLYVTLHHNDSHDQVQHES